jgi:hypothetical protein
MIYTIPFIIVYFYVAGRLRQSGHLNVGWAAAAAGAAVATLVTISFARHSYAPWVILLWAIGAGSVITVLMAGTLGWWKRSGGPSDYPRRPPIAVAAMSFMTFGLYAPVWSGVLWRDLKGALRDNRMSPVGHALAMLVPLYGSYRLRAQFDASNQLLAAAQSGERANARAMMMLSVASLILVFVLTLPVLILFAVLGLWVP